MNALIIKKKWLNLIFSNKKIWEIRGSKTNIRGKIGLIESNSGEIKGTCEIIDCIGPLNYEKYNQNRDKHKIDSTNLYYKNSYAWVLSNVEKFNKPIKYKHPKGAIIWVKIDDINN